jgi:hypothetical protein
MGLDHTAYQFLTYCVRTSRLGQTLTLARQWNYCGWKDPVSSEAPRYCEPVLTTDFGATSVSSVDASDYESPTYVHDLNQPLGGALLGTSFDSVLDFGTLEHVFDVPAALRSITRLCRTGGQIIHVQVANDYCGHGFWQFSPELFFSLYQPKNGFEYPEVFLADQKDSKHWVRCQKPRNGQRLEFSGRNVPRSYVLVRTRKLNDVPALSVQQSDYEYLWERNACGNNRTAATTSPKSTSAAQDRLAVRSWPEALRRRSRALAAKIRRGIIGQAWYQHQLLERIPVSRLLEPSAGPKSAEKIQTAQR